MDSSTERILKGLRIREDNCTVALDRIPFLRKAIIELITSRDVQTIPYALKQRILLYDERPATALQLQIVEQWWSPLERADVDQQLGIVVQLCPQKRLEVAQQLLEKNEQRDSAGDVVAWEEVLTVAEWCPELRERAALLFMKSARPRRQPNRYRCLKILMLSENPEVHRQMIKVAIVKLREEDVQDTHYVKTHTLELLWAKTWAPEAFQAVYPELVPEADMSDDEMQIFVAEHLWCA